MNISLEYKRIYHLWSKDPPPVMDRIELVYNCELQKYKNITVQVSKYNSNVQLCSAQCSIYVESEYLREVSMTLNVSE